MQCFIVVDNSRSGGEGEKATNYSNYTITLSHSRILSLLFSYVEIINKSRFAESHHHRCSTQLKEKRTKPQSITEGHNNFYLLKNHYLPLLNLWAHQIHRQGPARCVNLKLWCLDRVVLVRRMIVIDSYQLCSKVLFDFRKIGLNCTVCLRMFHREIWPHDWRFLPKRDWSKFFFFQG